MVARLRQRLFGRIPLRTVLVVPFVIQIVVAAGLVWYLSYVNGRRAVDDVSGSLRNEIMYRIEEHLYAFLETPHHINEVNASLLSQGVLDAGDAAALERHFWEQVQIFDSVTSIYFGNPAGGMVGSGREGAAGTLYVTGTEGFVGGSFYKYAVDREGLHDELLVAVPDFDARSRPWYAAAVAEGDATWSDVYILVTGQDMAIAASRPVYDDQGTLIGVLSVDIFIAHLSEFLSTIQIGEHGESFIVERSGLLVASSTNEPPFTEPDEDGLRRRLYATESPAPVIRQAANFLIEEFGGYDGITDTQHLEFVTTGQRQLLQVSPVQDDYGVDWIVAVVVPESDFMARIMANNRFVTLLGVIALGISAALGAVTAQWITRPIARLNVSARALAGGEWTHVTSASWIDEIKELTDSFNHMAQQLQQTLGSLTAEIAERKQAEAALRESQERLELTLEGAGLGMWDWNVQTSAVVFNERWATMLGYALEEIAPHFTAWYNLVHPDEIAGVMVALNAHLEGRAPMYQIEHRMQAKSGEWRWILSSGRVLVRDEQGNPLRAAGIHQDVTERKQAEEALKESHRRLQMALVELEDAQEKMVRQERLAAVGQLAAGIAHDFNNVLVSIGLYTQMSLLSEELPTGIRERLDVVLEQTHRAADLVQQILDFSRQAVIQRQPVNLALLARDVVKLLDHTLPENIEVRLVVESGPYVIQADPTRIQQAIVNLAFNARDAMPGGGTLRISLSHAEGGTIECLNCGPVSGGQWVRLDVTDTGEGIPPEVLPHIVEPFFTTKAPLGSGLGLAQVYGILKQHDGHLAVESKLGAGTTFTLWFPVSAALHLDVADSEKPVVVSGAGETILVVEDDDLIRAALVEVLEMVGYRLLEASNGLEALAVCEQQGSEIALIISDWVMPAMGGLELVRELEQRASLAKVLMLTGHPLDAQTKEQAPPRVVGWAHKPLNLEDLAAAVACALRA
ncbi:MAG: PAS domain-containing protein [Anaerolineae bacterium]|nr:PAS domain-containing protein [Anaerolineae bacterium]